MAASMDEPQKMLIEFYKDNRLLWDKDRKDYGKKITQKKALTSLLAKLEKAKAPQWYILDDV